MCAEPLYRDKPEGDQATMNETNLKTLFASVKGVTL
jgi:hypothetical protein